MNYTLSEYLFHGGENIAQILRREPRKGEITASFGKLAGNYQACHAIIVTGLIRDLTGTFEIGHDEADILAEIARDKSKEAQLRAKTPIRLIKVEALGTVDGGAVTIILAEGPYRERPN